MQILIHTNIIQGMIKIFNTYSKKKEVFKSIRGGRVNLYTCGPTVYNFAHIGNLRTYIFEDILRRTLEISGYKVKHVMNITDIDDKVIRYAKKRKKTIFEFTKLYEKSFFEDLSKLNIKKAWKYPKATNHIKEMITLISRLLEKELAYITGDGVYFDISKFKNYGKLSGTTHLGVRLLSRISVDEYKKKDAQDFALWKFAKPNEPSWASPFGTGRPGWHIECSAMSMKYLGETFDIHGGGVDLIFPHHENEIAQSEGATGKKFVNYFLEGEHLLVAGEKMSKSLGNIFVLRDIEVKKIRPLSYRYFVLGTHYRSKLNFTWKALEASNKALEKLYEFVRILKYSSKSPLVKGRKEKNFLSFSRRGWGRYLKQFQSAIFNDLNTPKALAVLWDIVHSYNKNPEKFTSREVLNLLYEFDEVFGLRFKKIKQSQIPRAVLLLVQRREQLRAEKNWQKSDEIRKKIQKLGYLIEDTSGGSKLSPVSPL